jgi:hypothetical protein
LSGDELNLNGFQVGFGEFVACLHEPYPTFTQTLQTKINSVILVVVLAAFTNV